MYITHICCKTLQLLSETKSPIWFYCKHIDYLPACQVLLMYPGDKFDKTYWHPGLTSYNREIGKARILLTDFEM